MGLEHCPGGELYQQLEGRGPLPLPDARQWAAEVVDILAYLREREVIHRRGAGGRRAPARAANRAPRGVARAGALAVMRARARRVLWLPPAFQKPEPPPCRPPLPPGI